MNCSLTGQARPLGGKTRSVAGQGVGEALPCTTGFTAAMYRMAAPRVPASCPCTAQGPYSPLTSPFPFSEGCPKPFPQPPFAVDDLASHSREDGIMYPRVPCSWFGSNLSISGACLRRSSPAMQPRELHPLLPSGLPLPHPPPRTPYSQPSSQGRLCRLLLFLTAPPSLAGNYLLENPAAGPTSSYPLAFLPQPSFTSSLLPAPDPVEHGFPVTAAHVNIVRDLSVISREHFRSPPHPISQPPSPLSSLASSCLPGIPSPVFPGPLLLWPL